MFTLSAHSNLHKSFCYCKLDMCFLLIFLHFYSLATFYLLCICSIAFFCTKLVSLMDSTVVGNVNYVKIFERISLVRFNVALLHFHDFDLKFVDFVGNAYKFQHWCMVINFMTFYAIKIFISDFNYRLSILKESLFCVIPNLAHLDIFQRNNTHRVYLL